MSVSGPLPGVRVLVAASAPGEESEFSFPEARYAIEAGGSLRVFGPQAELMAFGCGVWRAAWHVDAQGKPLGLSAPDRVAAAGLEAPKTSSARSERVLGALRQAPYQGVAELAQRSGEPAEEVERLLAAALAAKTLDPASVALAPIQRELDAALPELLAGPAPKNPKALLALLAERPATQGCDAIQLRVWIMRNPQKKAT